MLGRNAHLYIFLLGLIALVFIGRLLFAYYPGNVAVEAILPVGLLVLLVYLGIAASRSYVLGQQEEKLKGVG